MRLLGRRCGGGKSSPGGGGEVCGLSIFHLAATSNGFRHRRRRRCRRRLQTAQSSQRGASRPGSCVWLWTERKEGEPTSHLRILTSFGLITRKFKHVVSRGALAVPRVQGRDRVRLSTAPRCATSIFRLLFLGTPPASWLAVSLAERLAGWRARWLEGSLAGCVRVAFALSSRRRAHFTAQKREFLYCDGAGRPKIQQKQNKTHAYTNIHNDSQCVRAQRVSLPLSNQCAPFEDARVRSLAAKLFRHRQLHYHFALLDIFVS